jgi:hypothetical protein
LFLRDLDLPEIANEPLRLVLALERRGQRLVVSGPHPIELDGQQFQVPAADLLKRISIGSSRQHQEREGEIHCIDTHAPDESAWATKSAAKIATNSFRTLNSRKSVSATQNRGTAVRAKIHIESIGRTGTRWTASKLRPYDGIALRSRFPGPARTGRLLSRAKIRPVPGALIARD